MPSPTSAEVQRVLTRVFADFGAPARRITDRGMVFRSIRFELFPADRGVERTLTRPRRP